MILQFAALEHSGVFVQYRGEKTSAIIIEKLFKSPGSTSQTPVVIDMLKTEWDYSLVSGWTHVNCSQWLWSSACVVMRHSPKTGVLLESHLVQGRK